MGFTRGSVFTFRVIFLLSTYRLLLYCGVISCPLLTHCKCCDESWQIEPHKMLSSWLDYIRGESAHSDGRVKLVTVAGT